MNDEKKDGEPWDVLGAAWAINRQFRHVIHLISYDFTTALMLQALLHFNKWPGLCFSQDFKTGRNNNCVLDVE